MLSERTIEILENNDMKIYDRCEQDGEFTREIEFYSPEGEDVCECIFYDGTDESFIKAFRINAENFDANEHAEMWIRNRGQVGGVPESAKDLITDAEWIKNTLLSVADGLEAEETTDGGNDGFQTFKQLILNKCKTWEIDTEDIYFNQTRDNYYADYKPKYPNKSGADFTVVKDIWKNTLQIYGNFDALIPTIKPLETYGKLQ